MRRIEEEVTPYEMDGSFGHHYDHGDKHERSGELKWQTAPREHHEYSRERFTGAFGHLEREHPHREERS